ncbi:efflux RND transporter periplasmic adaptor subunit [Flavobacterium sp. HSC-61S13]|uniref:efflux RND transporter periplasmic adaptor subunit n=1 Tax=Flavobacterium sp. HSC-61S13 TaxID=2910963 RepID=UPI0020A0AD71|nr:efflux RND transporter periplasmic adaptor subunit [Flavobacterium sp. HSC-61S13]MCP1995505.1 cobalt-zinc-cadmium efflux system membrane fusion protein [Flavobacterium sp. HSC-61S13]
MTTKNILLFGFLALFLSCNKTTNTTEDQQQSTLAADERLITQEQFQSIGMSFDTLTNYTFRDEIAATGQIDVAPQFKAKVNAMLGGYIKAILVAEGQYVKQGQVVVQMENPDLIDIQKDYLETYEQIGYLKSEFERQKMLFEERIASQKNFLQAQSEYRTAQAKLKSITAKLNLLNVDLKAVARGQFSSRVALVAPISGTVNQVTAAIGMFVSPEQSMIEIVDTRAMQLNLKVFEKDIDKIKGNQDLTFQISETSLKSIPATIFSIGKTIDETNRTVSVVAHFPKEYQEGVFCGMFAEAKIATSERIALGVPTKAVVTEGDLSYVFILDRKSENNMILKKINVQILLKNEKYAEIFAKELKKNTKILVNGVYDINAV